MSTTTAQARLAAHESWARTADRSARTDAARAAAEQRFLNLAVERLGPGATPAQLADAAESARKAHYQRMAARSVAARRGQLQ
jgi:hypothetical protein